MDIYTQQSSSSPRPLSLIREEADQAQTKSHTTSANEKPSSSDMEDVLLVDVMQASTSPAYSQFDPLLPLDDKTAAQHQESAGLLATLSMERLGLSSMALDEFPSLQSHTLNSSDPSSSIASIASIANSCASSTLSMEDSTATPALNPEVSSLPLLPSFPHAKVAKLLNSRNIKNSTEFFLDSGIARAAEGESPPPWLWDAYRRASVAAVDSLLKEQQNQQRLLMEQQQQIDQMKLQLLRERMLHQNGPVDATMAMDFHPHFHHQFQGSSLQQPDQDQAPPLFWPTPSASSSSPSQLLETQTSTQVPSPPLSSTPASPRASKHSKRHDSFARQHGIARRASQGVSISGPLKGSAIMARSKSAVNSPSIGSRSALDRSSSPRTAHNLAKALGGASPKAHASFSHINHLELLQDLNSSASTSNARNSGSSETDSAMMMSASDYVLAEMDLTALLSVGMPFDFNDHMDSHHWDDRSHSPTGSACSKTPSPTASPSLSPTPSFTKCSSSSASGALASSSSSALSSLTNDDQTNNNDHNPAPVSCPIPNCNKSFARPINLTAHLKTHELPKPFACHLCERVFSRKHDLQRHIRVHTGSKPYVCMNMTCQKAFARTDALCRHYKVEEQCRRVVIQMQILENESRERERAKKEQLNVLFAGSGQNGGQETKEARGHGNMRKWQQFLVQQLLQQEAAALEKAKMLQIHQ
ncbi:hypothetical protein MVEG_02289, partial [Podila verticillata NRRL 6337]